MNGIFGAIGALTYALTCALCLSTQAHAQDLPDGKGKAEFAHSCSSCHRIDTVTRQKKTPEEWKKSVADMASRGAEGSPEDLNNIVLYLSANFGPGSTAPTAPTPSSVPAAQAALSAADLTTVNGIIADNGCVICHRIEKQGGYMGPSLNGVSARRTPDQIRSAIVSPHATVDPKNVQIQLTTADGKTASGRLISQDDHTVRIVDMSGAILTYNKAQLTQFKIVDTNPMPSYQKRIAPEDLVVLVRYLVSLPPLDETVQK